MLDEMKSESLNLDFDSEKMSKVVHSCLLYVSRYFEDADMMKHKIKIEGYNNMLEAFEYETEL